MDKLIETLKKNVDLCESKGEYTDEIFQVLQNNIRISYNEAKEIIALVRWKQEMIELLKYLD